jgi:DNA uptake protein ComE-like DNA-binding protein
VREEERSDEGMAPVPQLPQKRRKLPKRGTARERWLLTRLRRARRRAELQRQEIEDLKRRLGDLEPAGQGTVGADGRLDLNEASPDELRELGLNATQSARLIAYRERADGFDSIDEIEQIPGFGQATLRRLRARARTD